jgi:hypothetical protein
MADQEGAALNWRKSARCDGGSDCVEVANPGSSILIKKLRVKSVGNSEV